MRLPALSKFVRGRIYKPCTDPVFVFASGNRCGSTLLQRLLNSHADFLIWGEQNGYLNALLPASDEYADWAFDKSGERDEFVRRGYDIFAPNLSPPPQHIRRATAGYIEALFAQPSLALGKRVWGFKEVRYPVSVALLLEEYFPRARFIHLTRRLSDCVSSLKRWEASGEWTREWTRQSMRNWILINRGFINEGSTLRRFLSIRYEDMVAAPQRFVLDLSSFLDERPAAFDEGVFSRRLAGGDQGPPTALMEDERRMLSTDEVINIHHALKY